MNEGRGRPCPFSYLRSVEERAEKAADGVDGPGGDFGDIAVGDEIDDVDTCFHDVAEIGRSLVGVGLLENLFWFHSFRNTIASMLRAALLASLFVVAGQDAVKILETRCAGCHNGKTRQGGLDLTSREAALRGGGRGAAVVPGDVGKSLLYQFAAHKREPAMPLGGARLSEAELGAIAGWIGQGAPFNAPVTVAKHWAFQPVRRPAVPAGPGHPVDAFLEAERKKNGVKAAGEADRYTLLRRVYLDLTGVPPDAAAVRAFVDDTAPGAYERVVDSLLASPRYGERWGRHWMDIWRYSDWYGSGAEIRNSQPHIWKWRDWIIESLNGNKGYDRMVREMLAADEIAPGDEGALRATGFLVRNWFLFNRNVWLQDTIEGTTAGFLGLTLKCARCHDHKYDPLAQEDYYRFRAYFEPHDVRLDRVAGEVDTKKAGLARVYDAAPRTDVQNAAGTFINPAIFGETYLFIRGDERAPDKARPLTPATPLALGLAAREARVVELPLTAYYPDMRAGAQRDLVAAARARIVGLESELAAARERMAAARTAPKWERPAGPVVSFDGAVKPLLEARCGGCHLARNLKSGFNVASARTVMAGGKKHGAAVVAGKSAESVLVRILRGELSPRMPLNGPLLTAAEMGLIAAWIDQMPPPEPAVVIAEAAARLAVGEKELPAARAALAALEARVAAENARVGKAADAEALAVAARTAERRAGALLAEENVFRAQQRLAEALRAEKLDEGKVTAARRALEQAVGALDGPKEGYSPLGPQYPATSTGRRTALAEWMTARENPLTARVAVNHIWLRHFGAALVPSVIDFGRNGKRPTHPALLDWLAAEFMESGWDMKRLHRLLVTSAAYRMGSGGSGDNRWYGRMNARRLEAEAIRDSVLAVAGTLDGTMGGPELNEESQADVPRRSLYFRQTPDAQLTFLKVFDGADPTACFARTESIVPQQALALANSRLTLDHARILADRLAGSRDFVGDAFLRVLGRPVTAAERALSDAYMGPGTERRALLIHALFNRNEFVTLR